MRAWRFALLSLVLLALAALGYPHDWADAELALSQSQYAGLNATALFLNSREKAALSGPESPVMFEFTPSEDGGYLFMSFDGESGAGPDVASQLYQSGIEQPVATWSGEGNIRIEAQLEAGIAYFWVVYGAGDVGEGTLAVEVMREAHGRSYEQPIGLPGQSTRYAKAITRPRDTHWFSLVAPVDGVYGIRTETAQDMPLDTQGYLLDANGVEIAYNDDVVFPGDPNFSMYAALTAGQTYYVRVNAFSNLTGVYRLVVVIPEIPADAPSSIAISHTYVRLGIGEEYALGASVVPDTAYPDVVWASSDYAIARVSPDGVVTAVSAGDTVITAIGYGGAAAKCIVHVPPVPLNSIEFTETEVSMPAEGLHALTVAFEPADATNQSVSYQSTDSSIATVGKNGVIEAVSQGEVEIIATAADGLTARVKVTVTARESVYRALVMGEQNYQDGRTRVGAVNTAQGVADMLAAQGGADALYQVTLQLDSTRDELVSAIRKAFDGARPGDVSLFYINCHGDYVDGVAYIELHDGSRITAGQLYSLLQEVDGEVVVMIDCCRSGGFIGQSGGAIDFETGVASAFGAGDGTRFTTGRYKVITSAGDNQDSYRISSDGTVTEASMATVFARSLCEGAGWDLVRDKRGPMKADLNRDRAVTFQEIFAYARSRVNYYLRNTDVEQTVQVFPEGDDLVLFRRTQSGT